MKEIDIQLFWLNNAAHFEELFISNGSSLKIIDPGRINFNEGPDFLHSVIKIADTTWIGSIEIHRKTSEWYSHQHHTDQNYQNVILHVVWEHDDLSFSHSPVLALSSFLADSSDICKVFGNTDELQSHRFQHLSLDELAELGLQRLERKSNEIMIDIKLFQGNWQFICLRKLIYAFGVPLNGEAFQELFDSIYPIFQQMHLFNEENLRCLLFGQARIFSRMNPSEVTQFCKLKYALQLKDTFIHMIRFRTRPSNFPEKRLQQFIGFIFRYPAIFRDIIDKDIGDAKWISSIRKELSVLQFNKIVINVFAPILIAYSKYSGMFSLRKKALKWMDVLPPESNKYTRKRIIDGDSPMSALHTQGIIEYISQRPKNYPQLKFT